MKAIKKINNNIAICLDSKNNELVAIGKGIGFPNMPYEIKDLSVIERTFYDLNPAFVQVTSDIPNKMIELSAQVVDEIKNSTALRVSSNLVFTLADHITFAVKRTREGIHLDTPLQYDIETLYAEYYKAGKIALKIFNQHLDTKLPATEASNLALHFLNAEKSNKRRNGRSAEDAIVNDLADIVAEHFQLYIDRHSFSYSRFATHIQYLLERQDKGVSIHSINTKMFEEMRAQYPDTFDCAQKIAAYLRDQTGFGLDSEEELYLMMHINRLRGRAQK